jgi:hypothetical protein
MTPDTLISSPVTPHENRGGSATELKFCFKLGEYLSQERKDI